MADTLEQPPIAEELAIARELRIPSIRSVPPDGTVRDNLGLLAELAGSWRGKGFNLIARPDKEGGSPLFLELNQTRETLKFDPISSSVPNRGFAQDDVELFGLTYLQKISDAVTGGALHIEPGIWVVQPNAAAPGVAIPAGASIVTRMGSIPHGNAILAGGLAQPFDGAPTLADGTTVYKGSIFPSFNSTPFVVGAAILAAGSSEFDTVVPAPPPPLPAPPPHGFPHYTLANPASGSIPRTPVGNIPPVPLPTEIDGVLMQQVVNDPIRLLQSTIASQIDAGFHHEGIAINIASSTSIPFCPTLNTAVPIGGGDPVAVLGGGNIGNIPFLQTNADSALIYATFWIQRVSHPNRRESFLQLQYAQMVLLNFPILGVPPIAPPLSWPHVSVATLHKVFG